MSLRDLEALEHVVQKTNLADQGAVLAWQPSAFERQSSSLSAIQHLEAD